MTARQFAEAKDVDYRTVVRWLQAGLVPGAELEEVAPGTGIKWWKIPADAVDTFVMPKAGRKKAAKKGK
jgi:predicted site-specific integrase-resolvase